MSSTANKQLWLTVFRVARDELLPFDGRWAMTWRVAAQCALTTMVFMVYGIPLAPIGCYLLLFLLKPDSTETTVMAIGLSVLLSLVVGVILMLTRWSIEYPIIRMTILLLGSFVFLFLAAASKLGPIGNIVALVIGFIMTILSDVPLGEVATRALLYAWLMGLTPMAVIILFNLLLGRSTPKLVQEQLLGRLQQVSWVLQGQAEPGSLQPWLKAGNASLEKRLALIKLLHLCPAKQREFMRSAVPASYKLLLALEHMPPQIPDALRQSLLAQCERAQQAMLSMSPQLLELVPTGQAWADEAQRCLRAIVQGEFGRAPIKAKEGFMSADAFTNPTYVYFALRTTAAAVICYLIYTALDWQDIHTAMVTCYVVALGSTAETVHKLVLRICGCLIGASMGIASIVFLMPYMTSITHLMLLVFVAILIAGWVAAGSERIAYAGIQIGLAFLLTVLQGFGPTMETSAATDRILGILLGNGVTFLVFTFWRPTSVLDTVRQHLSTAMRKAARVVSSAEHQDPSATDVAATRQQVELARESLRRSVFEPRHIRSSPQERQHLAQLIEQTEQLCQLLPFAFTRQSEQYQQAVKQLPLWQQSLKASSV